MAEIFRNEWSGKMFIELIWEFDDFVAIAKGEGVIFTRDQIETAMKRVVKDYSVEHGITYDVVLAAIRDAVTKEDDDYEGVDGV